MIVNLWYSKILLEIGGTDSIARFSEKPTRCWGSQKRHHFPWWRNGRFHGNRRSYSQRSTREQNRGGNCSVVGEIPQCGSFKGNVVYVNHGPIYDCLFRQCESCTCQIVKVILKICLKKSFSWSGWYYSVRDFFIYIYFIAIRFFPLNVYVDLQPRPSDPRLSGNSHRLPLWGKD